MKRSNTALVSLSVLACALAIGCGDAGGGSASAKADSSAASSAKPASSTKTAANSAAPSAAPKPGGDTAKPDMAPTPSGDVGSTIKYMPKTCEEARVFANTGKLLGGDVGKAMEALEGQAMAELSGKPDGDKAQKAMDAAKAEGFSLAALKEISVCGNKGNKAIVAIGFDTSGLKGDLPTVLSKIEEAASGKAPDKKDEDGVTYLTSDKGKTIAIKGNVIVAGDSSMDDLKAAMKASGEGAGDFADAASYVVWVKANPDGKGNVVISMKDAGSDYEVKATLPATLAKVDLKADPKLDKMNEEIQKEGDKLTAGPLKAFAPAVKNLKLTADGDNVVATTTFPQSALSDLAANFAKDPKGMMGGFGMH